MFEYIFSENFLLAVITASMPIVYASMAALISNKVNLLNINVEGSMAISAVVGALVSHFAHSWALGLLAAVVAGVVMSLVLGVAALKLKTNSILSGIALNTFATGMSIFLLYSVLGVKGDSSGAPSQVLPTLKIPFLSDIPVIGKALFGQNLLFYIAILSVVFLTVFLNRTKTGRCFKATGFNEQAARSVGINTSRQKFYALIMCGVFCGLGGAYLSMVSLSYFSAGMVGGRGFIGIAAEAMGAGTPWLTLLFALLFGAVDSFALGSQTLLGSDYYELLNILPYLMTLIALIIYAVVKKSKEKVKPTTTKGEKSDEKSLGN